MTAKAPGTLSRNNREATVTPSGLAAKSLPVTAWPSGRQEASLVAEETPVAICYNGISHVVMMATPANLTDLAVGFSITEGIVDSIGDIYGVEETVSERGIEVHLDISAACFHRLKQHRRHLAGRTGCGLCGRESLDCLNLDCPRVAPAIPISHEAIHRALECFTESQPLYRLTGAVHGAAWCDAEGNIRLVMEDVGRHNALDKLIGQRARAGDNSPGFLLISSRASYEIVQKSARAGIGTIVAVSAPTSLAVEMAEKSGITLVGFAREGRHSVYTHTGRAGGS